MPNIFIPILRFLKELSFKYQHARFNSFSAKCDFCRSALNHNNDSRFVFLVSRPFIQVPTCLVWNQYFSMSENTQVNSFPRRAFGALRLAFGALRWKHTEESCWPGHFHSWRNTDFRLGMLGLEWKVFSQGIRIWYRYHDPETFDFCRIRHWKS